MGGAFQHPRPHLLVIRNNTVAIKSLSAVSICTSLSMIISCYPRSQVTIHGVNLQIAIHSVNLQVAIHDHKSLSAVSICKSLSAVSTCKSLSAVSISRWAVPILLSALHNRKCPSRPPYILYPVVWWTKVLTQMVSRIFLGRR